MDAPLGPVDVDRADELERLRARAYGPNADIAGDPAAQARLTELEAARRRPIAVGAAPAVVDPPASELFVVDVPVVDVPLVDVPVVDVPLVGQPWRAMPASRHPEASHARAPHAGAASPNESVILTPTSAALDDATTPDARAEGSSTPSAPSIAVGEPPASIPPATRPWWRRRRSWIAIIGAIAVLAVAGVVYAWLSPRAPDFVLSPQSTPDDPPDLTEVTGYLDWLGIDAEDLRRFDDFRGFSVWSAESRYGTDCIVVTHEQLGGTGGCATDGLAPTADIMRYQGWGDEMFGDMPTGSLVRFTLVGDRVNVYLAAATLIGANP